MFKMHISLFVEIYTSNDIAWIVFLIQSKSDFDGLTEKHQKLEGILKETQSKLSSSQEKAVALDVELKNKVSSQGQEYCYIKISVNWFWAKYFFFKFFGIM